MSFSLPTPGAEALLLALVLGAAVYDVRYRKIPNWLNLLGVLLGVLLNTFPGFLYTHFLSVDWSGFWTSLKGLGLAFAIYVVLYALRAVITISDINPPTSAVTTKMPNQFCGPTMAPTAAINFTSPAPMARNA